MPRIRTIKPDFFTSPDTAAVDFPVRIFYAALWCWADDFGIGETNLNSLLGHAFPETDGFTAQDVRRFCADCARHFDVAFYTVRGRHYFAIPSWEKHQKTEKRDDRRRHPAPTDPDAVPDLRFYACADSAPEVSRETGAESSLERERERERERESSSVALVGGSGGKGPNLPVAAKAAPVSRGTRLPTNWRPDDDAIAEMRRRFPAVDLKAEHEKFTNYWHGQAGAKGRKCDWPATWRNWIIRASEQHPLTRAGPNGNGIGKPSLKALGHQAIGEQILAEMDQP